MLVVIAGCYAPHAAPGSPCNPTTANCPEGQSCLLVGGSYACTAGAVADAAAVADSPRSDAPRDAFARPDAPADAATAAWTLIQTAQSENTASVSFAPTTTGSLIIVGVETTSTIVGISDDGANLYREIPNARGTVANANLGIDLWYARSSIPVSHIMVAAPSVSAIVVWEVAGIRSTSPVDTAAALSDQAATTLPAGASVTTAQPGELVISVAIVENQVSGIHQGNEFTNDRTAKGNGWAHLTSASAPAGPHQATWDQPMSGVYCAASAAFFTGP